MEQKLYSQMTAEEQLEYVRRLSEFETLSLPILESYSNGKTMTQEHRLAAENGMRMLMAFPFCRDYAEKALRFGDYERRVYRLRHYVGKVKNELAKEVAVSTADGQQYAYVPRMQQQFRRRGRPTREEAAAMARMAANTDAGDIEMQRQQAIAAMLGMDIVTNQTIREKNNDELAEERKAREAKEAAQNPSLFDVSGGNASQSSGQNIIASLPPSAFDRATLSQLSFLLAPDTAERVATVRDLRSRASVAAETAKMMAQRGEKPEEVEVYAQEAAQATEAYERIYEDVDRELATVYLRLKEDKAFISEFIEKYYKSVPEQNRIIQLTQLTRLLKPYYQKQGESFAAQVRKEIAENNPDVVAAKKEAAERKAAAEKIIKYLRRTDKENTARRVEGMEKKYAELVSIIGEDAAKPYYVFVEKAREDMTARQKKD